MSRFQWQDNFDAEAVQETWQGAQDYCSNLRLGGYHDWVLPTISDFETIDYSSFTVDFPKSDLFPVRCERAGR